MVWFYDWYFLNMILCTIWVHFDLLPKNWWLAKAEWRLWQVLCSLEQVEIMQSRSCSHGEMISGILINSSCTQKKSEFLHSWLIFRLSASQIILKPIYVHLATDVMMECCLKTWKEHYKNLYLQSGEDKVLYLANFNTEKPSPASITNDCLYFGQILSQYVEFSVLVVLALFL